MLNVNVTTMLGCFNIYPIEVGEFSFNKKRHPNTITGWKFEVQCIAFLFKSVRGCGAGTYKLLPSLIDFFGGVF